MTSESASGNESANRETDIGRSCGPEAPLAGRILLADDDRAFRETTALVLRRRGYACESVADAPEAAERLRATEFDLLISDIQMPGNADLEMIRELPQVAAGLPVILLTGEPTLATAAESVRHGVVAYLTKPPDVEELVAIADEAIARFRAFRAVSANHERLQTWCRDLEQLRSFLRQPRASRGSGPWQTFFTLSLGHIIESLVELKNCTEALAASRDAAGNAASLERSRPLVLIESIRETVAVLERTKGAFKSRELGELRRKLERLLEGC